MFAIPPWGVCSPTYCAEGAAARSVGEMTRIHGPAGFAAESLLIVGLGCERSSMRAPPSPRVLPWPNVLPCKARDHVAVLLPEAVDHSSRAESRHWLRESSRELVALACARPSQAGTNSTF